MTLSFFNEELFWKKSSKAGIDFCEKRVADTLPIFIDPLHEVTENVRKRK